MPGKNHRVMVNQLSNKSLRLTLKPLGRVTQRFVGRRVTESAMATTVAQMTTSELREMIETIIEQKLLELLGDPDEGLPIRKSVRDRLLRQQQAVTVGERGEPLEDVVRRLGLE